MIAATIFVLLGTGATLCFWFTVRTHVACKEQGRSAFRHLRTLGVVLFFLMATGSLLALDFVARVEISELNDRRLEFPDFAICEQQSATPSEPR